MLITQDFVEGEMASLEQEMANAKEFVIKAQGALATYRTILQKLQAPEPEATQPEQ